MPVECRTASPSHAGEIGTEPHRSTRASSPSPGRCLGGLDDRVEAERRRRTATGRPDRRPDHHAGPAAASEGRAPTPSPGRTTPGYRRPAAPADPSTAPEHATGGPRRTVRTAACSPAWWTSPSMVKSAATGSHPSAGSSDKPLPDPPPPILGLRYRLLLDREEPRSDFTVGGRSGRPTAGAVCITMRSGTGGARPDHSNWPTLAPFSILGWRGPVRGCSAGIPIPRVSRLPALTPRCRRATGRLPARRGRAPRREAGGQPRRWVWVSSPAAGRAA